MKKTRQEHRTIITWATKKQGKLRSSASISLIALPGRRHDGSQSKFIPPYVVEVDKLGQAIAVPSDPLVHRQKDKGREGA